LATANSEIRAKTAVKSFMVRWMDWNFATDGKE
jgi:hypothetical protein